MSLREVCRACLSSSQTMFSLLESIVPKLDSPPKSVVKLRKIFNKILTATEDSFSDKICTNCVDEIQRAYSFMLKCERSEDILKKIKNHEILVCSKRLGIVSTSHENDSSNISQIKNENIECDNSEDANEGGQFEVIHTNVEAQIDPRSQNSLIVKYENVGIQLLDHLDIIADGTNDEISVLQDIKQEPELDLYTEKSKFDELETEHRSSTETVVFPGCLFEYRGLTHLEKYIIVNYMEGQMCKLCNLEFEGSTVDHCSKHIKSSTRKQRFMNNVRYSKEGKSFKCGICSNTFQSKKKLAKHLSRHTTERPFKCEFCVKTFKLKNGLTRHLKKHKCERCPKAFKREQDLVVHIRSHTEERPFKCEICPETFRHKMLPKTHLKRHPGEGPFECESCPKAFIRKQDLTKHLTKHTGELPFKCDSCSKTFRRKRYLMEHLSSHTGERGYKCKICPETFQRKQLLNKHLNQHTEVRQFKCESCSKTFQMKRSLVRHLKDHTAHRPYKCEICLKTFKREHVKTI